MSAEFPVAQTLLSVQAQTVAQTLLSVQARFADKALKAATKFFFVVTVASSALFALAVASFYGVAAARGNLIAWNAHLSHGYVAGDAPGNVAVAMHLASAVILLLAGAVQFIPQVRVRFPAFHRWNGRVYVLVALTLSTAGLYMTWVLHSVGDIYQHIGASGHAVAIWLCAFMAARYAIARDFSTHRRWAIRLFLVVSASLFIRAILFGSFILFKRPVGFNPFTFSGWFLTVATVAQYALPLAVVELYFRAQSRPGALRRLAMACVLTVLTLAMGAGLFGVVLGNWVPNIKAAFDGRKSIAQIMSNAIAAGRVDQAVEQYRQLKASSPKAYNFDRDQLDALGDNLLYQKKFKDAIRIYQLNVEAYPQSSATYNSLGKAYLDAGNPTQAIANFRQALRLNPKSRYAAAALTVVIRK